MRDLVLLLALLGAYHSARVVGGCMASCFSAVECDTNSTTTKAARTQESRPSCGVRVLWCPCKRISSGAVAMGGWGHQGSYGYPWCAVFALKQPRAVSVQVGAWSKKHPELASKIVVATKFGETFDTVTGETSVDLSADAAIRCLEASMRRLGRVDILYSHVTSQISNDAAQAVLTDPELNKVLREMRTSGKVKLIGTSISHTAVILKGLEEGWFDVFDVVQLPAPLVVQYPEIPHQLQAKKVMVVVNSLIRKMGAIDGGPATPESMYHTVLGVPGVTCCLTGTRHHLDETMGYFASFK
eukprot:m.67084 g.67084  ORF g.67084 m.67084 type:complete len:299 (+) comp18164_c0_seq1:314-1210(+)